MRSRILITGAQGFVGRYLVSHLLRSSIKYEIMGLGRSSFNDDSFTHSVSLGKRCSEAPLPEELQVACRGKYYRYVSADIQDQNEITRILREFRPDIVIHLASALRDDSPKLLFRTNLEGTVQFIEAIALSNIKLNKLVIGSSGGVYGIPETELLPLSEGMPCAPVDLYSVSKLAVEQASDILTARYNIPTVWARMFNLTGPGLDERHVCSSIISQVAAILIGESQPILEVGSLEPTRDFIDVRDIATALVMLADKGIPGGVYNVASGIETSIASVLDTILDLAGLQHSLEIQKKCFRKVEIPRHFANIGRIKKLGFKCHYDLKESLDYLLNYYRHTVRDVLNNQEQQRCRK